MLTVNVGSILMANSATWINEDNLELTGTVGNGNAPYQLYLGPSASPNDGAYVNYFLTYSGMASPYNSKITSYSGNTKIATVSWLPNDANPPPGRTWRLFIKYPVLSAWQWKRDGVNIPGAIDRVYTVTNEDIGKYISFSTIGGEIPTSTDPSVIAKPTVTTTSLSEPCLVLSSQSSNSFINSSSDFTLLGAFKISDRFVGKSFHIIPAAYSSSGTETLYVGGLRAESAEFSIPPLTQNYNTGWFDFPSGSVATRIAPPISANYADIFNGLFGTGIEPSNGFGSYGSSVIPNSNQMIASYTSPYTGQPTCVFARRPIRVTTSTPVDLFIPWDPNQTNSRWAAGNITNVPSEYISSLGGDMLVSGAPLSIHANLSQGPCALVFNSADISTYLTRALVGTSIRGSSTTMVLDSNANIATPDFYKNCFLVCSGVYCEQITGYDITTRTISVANPVLPTGSTSYRIIPYVPAKQLIGFNSSLGGDGKRFFGENSNGILWDPNGITSSINGGFTVPNVSSFMCLSGIPYGDYEYGISYGALPNNAGTRRLYNPYNYSFSPGDKFNGFYYPDGANPSIRAIVYNVADMAEVAAGRKAYNDLIPVSVTFIPIPYAKFNLYGCTFDNATGKLYVLGDFDIEYSYPVVLVYQVRTAARATTGTSPVITTTSLNGASVGQSYTFALSANGIPNIFNWSIVSGSISPLILNSANGVITGTPETPNTLSAIFRVTNAYGFDQKELSIPVTSAAAPVILTKSIQSPAVGLAFTQQLLTNGPSSDLSNTPLSSIVGTSKFTWTENGNNLSQLGLSLTPEGLIQGANPVLGTRSVSVTCTSSTGSTQASFPITVRPVSVASSSVIEVPKIVVWKPASATSGDILTLDVGKYVSDDGIAFTGTIGASDMADGPDHWNKWFYIGSVNGLSSNNDEYVGWHLFADGVVPYAARGASLDAAYCSIYAYDASTKRVLVNWVTSPDTTAPAVGGQWRLIKGYPFHRKGRWLKNGTPIANAVTRVYTTTPSDVGSQITYEESVGDIDWQFKHYYKEGLGGSATPPEPTLISAATSTAYTPTLSFSSSNRITSVSDFSYLGSFRVTSPGNDARLHIVPASQSASGQVSLVLLGGEAIEQSIPALRIDSNVSALNPSVVTRTATREVMWNGWSDRKNGFSNGPVASGAVVLPSGSDMIAGLAAYYSAQDLNVFVKRPSNISTVGAVTPFYIPAPGVSSRWTAGSISEIPQNLRSSLGGDYLISSGCIAIAGVNSQGPAARVFSSSDVDAATAKYETGTVVSGSSTTAILPSSSSGIPGYYVGFQVSFEINGSRSFDATGAKVTGYNATTKEITFTPSILSVPAGATYHLLAPVQGKQLLGLNTAYEPDSKAYPSLWNTAGGSFTLSSFIPRGTSSLVSFTTTFTGKNDYGLWLTYTDTFGTISGGKGQQRTRMSAQPQASTSPGPVPAQVWSEPNTNQLSIWVHDTNDLAAVNAGTKAYTDVTPTAIFNISLPYSGASQPPSVAFDQTSNRMYVYQSLAAPTSAPVVHVYSCSKYV